jgi:hypothetical protein
MAVVEVVPGLDRERALSRGGKEARGVEQLGDGAGEPEPPQPGVGEHDGVEVVAHAAQAGRHVPADVGDLQVGPGDAELAGPSGGAGADMRSLGQVPQREAVPGAERVPRVLPRRGGGDRQAGGRRRGQVLEGVDDEVDPILEQGRAQGGREHAGAAERGEGGPADVALRPDDDELDRAAAGGLEGVGDALGLGAGEVGTAGAEAPGSSGGHLPIIAPGSGAAGACGGRDPFRCR